MSENDLFEQIDEIKKLSYEGLGSSLFFDLLINAHNGTSASKKNTFTIDEWVEHYEVYKIVTNPDQLILFFEYLQRFHSGLISKSDKKYTLINSPRRENFGLELIVLKTMDND
ncbi:HAD family hydrolase [Chryseobacterium jejuense]|nr:hypothetical protein [Chryseobacterium jejuense]